MDISDKELDAFIYRLMVKIHQRQRYRKATKASRLLQGARYRARQQVLEFDLTPDDILIPLDCPYLGIPLIHRKYEGRCFDSPSLDRIDPSKGYVKGNVEVVSELANRMKQDATKEQLIAFAKAVLQRNT